MLLGAKTYRHSTAIIKKRMTHYNTPSSFHGVIEEMPEVSVDNFQNTTSKAYFLSHCHTDHTSGLYSEALLNHLKENKVFVYMSVPSAAIVQHESGASQGNIMDFVKPLSIGTSTIVIRCNPFTDTDDIYIDVTLLPAGHCFGSVMFLFRTPYDTILYTGDFRISNNSVSKYAQLHDEKGDVIEIDTLYIDTTFLTLLHNDFPKRTDSTNAIIQYIDDWLHKDSNNLVALHTSAKYGYEFVFNKIYEKLGEKVYVGPDIWRLYSQFPNQLCGVTNDESQSKIHLCRNRTENKDHENCVPKHLSSRCKYLYIHFSALKWVEYEIENSMVEVKNGPNYRIDVCFATHCSKNEIEYFVSYLNPRKVVGFPNKYLGKEDIPKMVSVVESKTEEEPKFADRDLLRRIFQLD